jgi:DNA-directed RNA polymerase
MKTVLEQLCDDLTLRQQYLLDKTGDKVDKRKKAWKIYDIAATDLIEITYGHILSAVESRGSLASLVINMGKSINRKFKLEADEVEMAHMGWFILVSYFELKYIKYIARHIRLANGRKSKYPTYHISVINTTAINSMLKEVDKDKVDLFPVPQPSSDWTNTYLHPESKYPLIKNAPEETIVKVEESDLSYITETLNKLNRTGWRINETVFEVFKKCMKSEKTPFKFSREIDPKKKASLLIEINAITGIADRNLANAFYHLYNLDFRGRIYPNTAFLHEQSSDNAKGLLLLDEAVVLGEEGFYWLCVHTANVFGKDGIPLDERVQWVQNNMEDICKYAIAPMENTDWMDADKPFCFLAACVELNMLDSWVLFGNLPDDFPSCLPVYIDGSNNGTQHLVAMSKDEVIAPLVNLVPSDQPGDVYMFIANHAIAEIHARVDAMSIADVAMFDMVYNKYLNLLRDVERYPEKSDKKKLAKVAMLEFKNHNHDIRTKLFPVYWSRINDKKIWRKTVKRNVMTLAYGGTRQGMGEQVVDDTRDLSQYLRDKEIKWGYMLGSLIYDVCYKELKGPAKMLRMFQDLAKRENDLGRHLEYNTPITNFPFRHNYRKAKSREVSFYYGEDRIRLTLSVWQEATLDKQRQKTGTPPNVVHNLDAVHVAIVVHDAPYTVTVVHDSFGCHAGNMGHMFMFVRYKFVELYEGEPLEYIMKQVGSLDLIPEKGNLDVREVLNSDFAFA